MTVVIKVLFFVIFAAVIFGRAYIASSFLYWSLYGLMGLMLVALWYAMFAVSKKKAEEILGNKPEFMIFVGKIPTDVRADLDRGQLCLLEGKLILVQKKEGKYSKTWQIDLEKIKSIGFGKVGGSFRYGFTIHTEEGETEFVCSKIKKERENLFKAIGWK